MVKRQISSVSLLNHGQINGSCVNSPEGSLEWPSPPPPSSFLSQLRMPMIDSCKILLADPLISSAVSFQSLFSPSEDACSPSPCYFSLSGVCHVIFSWESLCWPWCIIYKAADVCFTLHLTLLSRFRHITAFIFAVAVNQRGFILKGFRPAPSVVTLNLFPSSSYTVSSYLPCAYICRLFQEKDVSRVCKLFCENGTIINGRILKPEGRLWCCVTFRQHNCISNFSLRVITAVAVWCDRIEKS